MTIEDRQEVVATFGRKGGILVATTALLTADFSLPDVTDLVLYDLPDSDLLIRQVLGRFDPLGRISQLNIYALVQSDGERGMVEQLGKLRGMQPA